MPLILDGTTGASLIATTAIPASVVLSTPASGTMTNVTAVPAAQLTGTVAVANGGTGVTSSTGSGANVLGTSPTLTTPALGTPASGVLTNCTGAVVAALSTASGSAPSYSARAWVNFNGTGTVAIRDSANVSSITDNGAGDYTVNFTTAMADANFTTVATGNSMTGDASRPVVPVCTSSTASNTTIQTVGTFNNNTNIDISGIFVTVVC